MRTKRPQPVRICPLCSASDSILGDERLWPTTASAIFQKGSGQEYLIAMDIAFGGTIDQAPHQRDRHRLRNLWRPLRTAVREAFFKIATFFYYKPLLILDSLRASIKIDMSAYPPLAIGLLVAALANLLVYFFSPFLLRSRWTTTKFLIAKIQLPRFESSQPVDHPPQGCGNPPGR